MALPFSGAPTEAARQPLYKEQNAARTVEELTRRNIETIAQLEAAAQEKRTIGDRIADAITSFCGSTKFVWVHVFWFGAWIAFNVLLPKEKRFDAYPFEFLTLVVSLEAIFLSTFILISQNRDARIADRRNHLDLQVNLLAEQENTKMLQLLEAIARKVGADMDSDPSLQLLAEATDPEVLVKQIDRSMNEAQKKIEAKNEGENAPSS